MSSLFSSITDTSERSIALSTEYTSAATIRRGFLPMNGVQEHPIRENRLELLADLQAEALTIRTRDTVSLDAVWCPSKRTLTSPTVIVFHGNGCVLDTMHEYAAWYKARGLNVLLVTIRGYPGSTGDAVTAGELGLYRDVEACVRTVLDEKKVMRNRLFLHGYSLGGALAGAGYFFELPMTLDHTFPDAHQVMRRVTNQSLVLPETVTKGIAKGTWPVDVKDGQLVTDGLNTVEKLRKSTRPFFIMYGKDDALMPNDFALQFLQARCGLNPTQQDRARHLAEIPGGHWGPFTQHAGASRQYEQYLRLNNLMD